MSNFKLVSISQLFIKLLVFLVFFVWSVFFMGVLPMMVVFSPILIAVIFTRLFRLAVGFYALCIIFLLTVVVSLSSLYPKSYSIYDSFYLVGFSFVPSVIYEVKGRDNFDFNCVPGLNSGGFDCYSGGERIFAVGEDDSCSYYTNKVNGKVFLGVRSGGVCSIDFFSDLKKDPSVKLVVDVNSETLILYLMFIYSLVYCLVFMVLFWLNKWGQIIIN